MANPTGIGGKKFQKGQSGNPGGRRKETSEVTLFKKTTYEEFINYLQKYGSMTKTAMKKELEKSSTSMFETIFARIIFQAAMGEKDARQVLLERLWGKVKDQVEHSGKMDYRDINVANMSNEELISVIKEAYPELGIK